MIECVATSEQSIAFFYAQYAFGCLRIFCFTEVFMTVTFSGERRLDFHIAEFAYVKLKIALEQLIRDGADRFLLGGCSDFDKLAAVTLKLMKKDYPHIEVVLVVPHKNLRYIEEFYDSFEYPELEPSEMNCYAEVKRNWYMLSKADCLVTFVYDYANGVEERLVKYAKKNCKNLIIKDIRHL